MVKSAVQVCVRTRPTAKFAHDNLKLLNDAKGIEVHIPKDSTQYINNQLEDWRFNFDHVLDNASQQTVYETCAEDIVASALEGYNGTILAYGQTGAGKTFTMVGGQHSYEYRGIIPRALSQIFRHVQASSAEKEYRLRASYLEIYNETFFDLLDPTGGNISDVAVQEDDRGVTVVKGLTLAPINTEEDALNLLFTGDTNRAIGSHLMNKESSRSHCIFTIHLECQSRVESLENIMVSKLNLVDLAGSERVKKTGSTGVVLDEARFINKSLTFLEQVVMALGSRTREHVPFRQSKLTNVLRDSLGGNCKTRLIANIWAEKAQMDETISTLKFATRMMRVSMDATVNIRLDPEMLVKKYEMQVRELKHELAMHDTLVNRVGVVYDEFTPEQQMEMQSQVTRYVNGELDEIEIVNVRQIRELFKQFRIYCQTNTTATSTGQQQQQQKPSIVIDTTDSSSLSSPPPAPAQQRQQIFVGDIDNEAGFSIGEAPSHAAPPIRVAPSPRHQPLTPKTAHNNNSPANATTTNTTVITSSPSKSTVSSSSLSSQPPPPPPEEEEVYPIFLASDEGGELKQTLSDNRTALKAKKQAFKAISQQVNDSKMKIDELAQSLETLRRVPDPDGFVDPDIADTDVVEEEEYALIRELQQEKNVYQQLFAQRRDLQTQVVYHKGMVEASKTSLARGFERWYQQQYGHLLLDAAAKAAAAAEAENRRNAEELDDAERFDQLEIERVMNTNPDSIHFYNAQKNIKKLKANGGGGGGSARIRNRQRPTFV